MNDTQPPFRYETHLHTREASACARATGAEMVAAYMAAGYAGIIITDHFFNGNSSVPRTLPWAARVEQFCMGYENARAAAAGSGFRVFFGWEYNDRATEFITLGLGKDFLLAHPDMLEWTLETYLRRARDAGAFIIHAHPFRKRDYIPEIRLFPDLVDAVEIRNPCNGIGEDDEALDYAAQHSLPVSAGSDRHSTEPGPITGVGCSHRMRTLDELIAAIRAKAVTILETVPSPRFDTDDAAAQQAVPSLSER